MSRPALFLRIETDPVIRVWSGSHPYPLPADGVVEIEGGEYLPLALTSIPALDRMLNDAAGEYDLSLSGVAPETLHLLNVPDDLPGARVNLGQIKFDARWQRIGGVDWFADFDAESVGWSLTQNGDTHDASVSLKIGTASTDRRLAAQLHWSPVEQAVLSPSDKFFEFVPTYALGSERQYPA